MLRLVFTRLIFEDANFAKSRVDLFLRMVKS